MRRLTCTVLALCGALSPAGAAEPVALPVVHTWGDLRKAPKLTVTPETNKPAQIATKTATFQLGLSSAHATTYGAVVLYFLGETGSRNPYTPEEWGDFWVQVDGKSEGSNLNGRDYGAGQDYQPVPGHFFHAEAIPFLTPGDHVVELIAPPGKAMKWVPSDQNQWVIQTNQADGSGAPVVLARATVHVKGEPEARWSPFWEVLASVGGGAKSDTSGEGDRYAIVPVNNPKGGACLPKPPRPFWYTNLPPPDFPLPQLIPQDAGTHVNVKLEDSTLVVTLDSKIVGFFPEDLFLTRWWLNGKPAGLDWEAEPPGQMRVLDFRRHSPVRFASFRPAEFPLLQVGTLVWYTHIIHFDLAFKPEWLGAKQGDRVGVQLLFCPGGYRKVAYGLDVDFGEEEIGGKNPVLPPANFSQLSDKIEFTYTGDPRHPWTP